jgi:cytochrome c-type biogenesis protein CcmE
VARKRNPARLVVALSVAAVLAVFLLYTSIAGGGTPSVQPSELAAKKGRVAVSGHVVGPITGDAHAGGLFFRLRDVKGGSKTTVRVKYEGSVPDLFRVDRDVHVQGEMRNGVFQAVPGTLVTKCPSKYAPAKKKA